MTLNSSIHWCNNSDIEKLSADSAYSVSFLNFAGFQSDLMMSEFDTSGGKHITSPFQDIKAAEEKVILTKLLFDGTPASVKGLGWCKAVC